MMKSIAVIGAGISGSTFARLAAEQGHDVIVFESKPRPGGMARDAYMKDGIVVPDCGPHLFHTNDEEIINFVIRFGEWRPITHKVIGISKHGPLPFPPNYRTLNIAYGVTPDVAEEWIDGNLGRISDDFYRAYSAKQWGVPLEDVPISIINRVKVRFSDSGDYFPDEWTAVPSTGYTEFLRQVLKHPRIKTLYSQHILGSEVEDEFDIVVDTGMPDYLYWFDGLPELEYRKVKFDTIMAPRLLSDHRDIAVFNHQTPEVPFTRQTYYQRHGVHHAYLQSELPGHPDGEPCYPLMDTSFVDPHRKRRDELAKQHIHFLGRTATYKYLDMDEAIRAAMSLAEKLQGGEL